MTAITHPYELAVTLEGLDLAALDRLDVEVLLCPLRERERPPQDVASACDWRMGGRISHAMQSGNTTGAWLRPIEFPTEGRFAFPSIVTLGAGADSPLTPEQLATWTRVAIDSVAKRNARAAALRLPPGLDPVARLELFLHHALHHPICAWVLLEEGPVRTTLTRHIESERRIRRRPSLND